MPVISINASLGVQKVLCQKYKAMSRDVNFRINYIEIVFNVCYYYTIVSLQKLIGRVWRLSRMKKYELVM